MSSPGTIVPQQGEVGRADDVVVFLPPAGSVTSPYPPIAARLPGPAVLHCETPGRGRLADQPSPASVDEAVDRWTTELVGLLDPSTDQRLHLFGHSLGALFAYEVAARLEASGTARVATLCVSGAREPGSVPRSLVATAFEALRRRPPAEPGGADPGDDWVAHDLRMRREYRPTTASVRAPLALFCGTSDPFARPVEMEAWRRFTTGPFLGSFTFPGGHDYHLTAAEPVADTIRRLLERPTDPRHHTTNSGVKHEG
ncbi:thioesterase II family protein [Streptomyces alkaliterrae]|uniref:Alpha/beta fold hydrolase n=1 Tax=Streptomyces alkaliterrae TaxID=2213162 RepID=A0A5P0YPQ3_9ACTN|nr:thioesterase domain-containing protein [Streptomyces alkaliterrae]MBB1259279.1 alpha/beta fold hydrolase [Streptomyces alkaliterrae]MQS02296.1 alpha/beta fold hydrolase [Streptomyces alkaliterrae]